MGKAPFCFSYSATFDPVKAARRSFGVFEIFEADPLNVNRFTLAACEIPYKGVFW
jgi:hypothetical protein